MTGHTSNFNLPYPDGSDRPCDFAPQWCDFTDAVTAVLDRFQTGINHANPRVPAALLRMTTPHSVINGQNIPFDEVVLDTAAMTDLDADPYHVTITHPGRYTVAAYIEKGSAGIPNSQQALFAGNVVWSVLDRGIGVTYSIPAYDALDTFAAGTQISAFFNAAGVAGAHTVDVAWLAVFWHSNTEAPI